MSGEDVECLSGSSSGNEEPDCDPFAKLQRYMETQFKATKDGIEKVSKSVQKLDTKVGINTRNLEKLRDSSEKNVAEVRKEFDNVHRLMDEKDKARQSEIKALREAVDELKGGNHVAEAVQDQVEKEMGKVRLLSEVAMGKPPSLDSLRNPRPSDASSNGKDMAYWMARRSLKLWPVDGRSEADIWRNCEKFMTQKLLVPTDSLSDEDFTSIRRVRNPDRHARSTNEILVVFSTIEVRDSVATHARNLAKFVDEQGLPTAGLRHVVPDHLIGMQSDLDRYGRLLRRIHGTGLKRNTRFDDSKMELFLSVRISGDEDWMRVDWAMAKDGLREDDKKRACATRTRLASSISSSSDVEVLPSNDNIVTPGPSGLRKSATLEKFKKTDKRWGNA